MRTRRREREEYTNNTSSLHVTRCVSLVPGFAQGERNVTASRGCKSHSNASSSIISSKAHLHRPRERRLTTEVWCIAMSNVSDVNLQSALDWACGPLQGQGQVNCGPINSGGACFDPDTTFHHASYAFNAFFQLSNGTVSACNFSGNAILTYTDPSESIHNSCFFNIHPCAFIKKIVSLFAKSTTFIIILFWFRYLANEMFFFLLLKNKATGTRSRDGDNVIGLLP